MSRLRAGIVSALAVAVAAASVPAVAGGDGGRIKLVRNTAQGFDRFITGSTPGQRAFARAHYWRMRAYPPFFDQALRWAPPAHLYEDLYGLSPDVRRDRRLVARHPNWVLRDANGRKLFIPWGCEGGSCAAWAADPGNRRWRDRWVRRARRQLEKGYKGVFIDNVNLDMRVSDGFGTPTAPIDPRTGAPMTAASWRRYIAGFTERIRRGLPKAEIVHNSIWYSDRADGAVGRAAAAADIVELERGCSDGGLVAGGGRFGVETFLAHIDWLHARGPSVLLEPYGRDPAKREYDLACYFLINTGRDAIASAYSTDPDDWWHGWDVALGDPAGPRYAWNGLLRRDFAKGFVVLNQPGRPSVSFGLDGLYKDLNGQLRVGTVHVGGGEGRVYVKAP